MRKLVHRESLPAGFRPINISRMEQLAVKSKRKSNEKIQAEDEGFWVVV